jgi:hypothetical protein
MIMILDGDVVPKDKFIPFLQEIWSIYEKGERIFIHCRGGHGRKCILRYIALMIVTGTGVVIACFLAKIHKIEAPAALELTQKLHDCREDIIKIGKGHYSSPETHPQRDMVYKILATGF